MTRIAAIGAESGGLVEVETVAGVARDGQDKKTAPTEAGGCMIDGGKKPNLLNIGVGSIREGLNPCAVQTCTQRRF